MKKIIFVLSIVLCSINVAYSQISQGGEPLSWNENFSKSAKIPTVKLKKVDVAKLLKEDEAESSKDVPLRFAYAHDVNLNPNNSGNWFTGADGGKFWILKLESKGAKSLNVTFSDFYIPEGAKLFIYNEGKTDVKGAFTEINNKTSRRLGTAPVVGDKLIIEYYQPKQATEKPALQISTVAHDYRGVLSIAKAFGDSGSCNNNVACSVGNAWRDQIRSVAMVILGNGTRWCSGSLINNTANNGTPYFLTANHCSAGRDVTNWVFAFNYESPGCSNSDGSLSQSISGSQMLASGASSDYALLRLSATPPSSYNVYYSGWDATGSAPTRTTGIHHPAGDVKKISFDNDPSTVSGYLGGSGTTHWQVSDWDDGTTEGGSSGSALFDQNKRIIGQLHGGYAACGNDRGDWYGRLSVTYPNICQWLAPGCSTQVVNGYDPAGDTGGGNDNCTDVTLTLNFDNYPEETSWTIKDSSGSVVESGGTYGSQADGSTLAVDVCLPAGCYELSVNDSYGDGMCCTYGQGSYSLTDASGTLASGASFGSADTSNFCVGSSRVASSGSKSISNNASTDKFMMYPNPANNVLYLKYKVKENVTLDFKIFDITGRMVESKTYDTESRSGQLPIDIDRLTQGAYFMEIIENNISTVRKFTITRR
ncbi:T9SS type A sorting domain-containing protein [Aquimarina algicola]|uniref:T9SS type A sorting domain-containing protein n=1 Tax=Aquimarina algicola TaxID=2589995 RepID=A0A504J5T3_9FLAO|nr:T9SS type A sorting domain-containing protein [Aquimarina algicola]TPN83925.1 T9SS type A sorting domain-containing protein [Aquimarina algicola]